MPLLLQSNGFMRALLTGLLRENGVERVLVERRAEQALDLLNGEAPPYLLIDWFEDHPPEEDRLKLVRRIRSMDSDAKTTPIILVSQPRGRQEIEQARDAGVTEFLITPVSPASLFDRIRSATERPREFIEAARFSGPDRRRRPRRKHGPSLKRMADVEAGLTTPIRAARAAALALANETELMGDPLAIRVGRSLKRFMSTAHYYTETEAEIAEMHRATLAQLMRMADAGDPLREPVVSGLEQVVARRMGDG